MTAEIRKHQHTLLITGYAVILFGIWDIVKAILNITVNSVLRDSLVNSPEIGALDSQIKLFAAILAIAMIVPIIAISIGVRIYVGRTAIRLGRGETRKVGAMIFWTVFLLIFAVTGIPMGIIGIVHGEDILNMAGTLLVDLTLSVMLIGMLIALSRIKKLTEQAGGQNAA